MYEDPGPNVGRTNSFGSGHWARPTLTEPPRELCRFHPFHPVVRTVKPAVGNIYRVGVAPTGRRTSDDAMRKETQLLSSHRARRGLNPVRPGSDIPVLFNWQVNRETRPRQPVHDSLGGPLGCLADRGPSGARWWVRLPGRAPGHSQDIPPPGSIDTAIVGFDYAIDLELHNASIGARPRGAVTDSRRAFPEPPPHPANLL